MLEGASTTEIGRHTKKTSWNRGIATEAAAGVRDLAFARFEQTRLVVMIRPDHLASRRVAEKIGMCEGAGIVFDGDPYVTYTCARPPSGNNLGQRSGVSSTDLSSTRRPSRTRARVR